LIPDRFSQSIPGMLFPADRYTEKRREKSGVRAGLFLLPQSGQA
jgi:hypothetical protein